MAEKDSIYKCNVCGNVISVIEAHDGVLVCCGKDMEKLEAKDTTQEGKEKHVPIIDGLTIKIGSIDHPMEEEHFIELIQVIVDSKLVAEKRLYPGDEPKVELKEEYADKNITAKTYCNVHGLWRSE